LPNLLIGLHESLQLDVEFSVLTSQNVAVMLKCFNLCPHVVIAAVKRLICETQVILFASSTTQSFVGDTSLCFKVVEMSSQLTVTSEFSL